MRKVTTLSLLTTLALLPAVGCVQDPPVVEEDTGTGNTDTGLPGGGRDGEGELPTGGDGDGDTGGDGDGEIIGDGDGDGEVAVDPVHELELVGVSPLTLFYGEATDLSFRVLDEDGSAVQGATVHVSQVGTAGQIAVANITTGTDGIATVGFEAASLTGSVEVQAATEFAADTVRVRVDVVEDPEGAFVLHIDSDTRIPVAGAEAVVYVGATTPSCATLEAADTLPTATFIESFSTLPSTRSFPGLETGSRVTVYATGTNGADQLVAAACREGFIVAGGTTVTGNIELKQLDTILDGDYDVLMHLPMGDALPQPYEGYVNTVSAVLGDPAGYAAYQALVEMDLALGTSTIVSGGQIPSYEDVAENAESYGVWTLVRDFVDDELENRLGQTYVDTKVVGGDVRNVVTDFEVGARYEMSATSLDDYYQVTEQWNDLVFEWSLGCAEGDLACARRPIALEETEYAPIASTYNAMTELAPADAKTERFLVRTDAHPMALRYGAIILIATDYVIFPNLPGNLAADSLSGVLNNLIDCYAVGEAIGGVMGGPATLYEGFCGLGLDYASGYIEDYVLSLQIGGENPELAPKDQTGVLGGGSFYLVDGNHDLVTEDVEALEMLVGWQDPENPELSEDISMTITGDGRVAATNCALDSLCDDGQACVPVGHYLKVADIEMTCQAVRGPKAGGETCSTDAQCASGLCSAGACFQACADDYTCGAGSSCLAEAEVDLDGLMDGLGTVAAATCVAN